MFLVDLIMSFSETPLGDGKILRLFLALAIVGQDDLERAKHRL